MSSDLPVIKFSPFEALLIGEKNRILKRQPMKNTIFVTRLNRRSQTVNLRDLFGLEKSTNNDSEVIFKMPQRVSDFLKHRKLQSKTDKIIDKEKDEILCYEFEGHKMVTTASEKIILKGKNKKEKLSKVKFKKKFKYKENFNNKVVKKFPNPIRKRHYYDSKSSCLVLQKTKRTYKGRRHGRRGKDGKVISKTDKDRSKTKEISPKQKYISNYLHHLYLKKNKELFSQSHSSSDDNVEDFQTPFSVKSIVGLPNSQFDIIASEAMLNEVSKKYYENYCHEDFQFPKFPEKLKPLDFESDVNLIDIIYENFPVVLKFGSRTHAVDFTDALLSTEILQLEEHEKICEKTNNSFIKAEKIRKILDKRFPLIRLEKINGILPNHCPDRNERNMFSSKIDEPCKKKNDLINGKSYGSFFFRNAEGKDIFVGNLMKPYLPNSWFGSIPEV